MKHCLPILGAAVALAIGAPASGQYMFIDVDGNGSCNSSDVLTTGTSSVDVYLKTNQNGNGSVATCPTGEPLTVNSYTFVVSAPTGGVTYGAWTDAMGFTINANSYPNGTARAGNDVWVAKASGTPSAPGTYKLGTLAITVTGNPTLDIYPSSTIDPTAITSFGSSCPGQDFDNTMKLPTDWTDVCGTAMAVAAADARETTWGKIKNLYRF